MRMDAEQVNKSHMVAAVHGIQAKYFVGSHAGDGINGTACSTWAEANELLTTQYGEDWQDSNELEIDPQESSFQD